MRIPLAMGLIALLAERLSATPMNKFPDCWEYQLDNNYNFAINGHRTMKKTASGMSVPPFFVYVECNGWPVGLIGMDGGSFADGGKVNQAAFVEALRVKLESLGCGDEASSLINTATPDTTSA